MVVGCVQVRVEGDELNSLPSAQHCPHMVEQRMTQCCVDVHMRTACSKWFTLKSQEFIHINFIHSKDRPFPSGCCDLSFCPDLYSKFLFYFTKKA